MKGLLLLAVIVVCGANNMYAQQIRFTDTTNIWKFQNYSFGDPYQESTNSTLTSFNSDTAIAGKTYRKLSALAFREDLLTGKLFYRFITNMFDDSPTDTLEHLYFDYYMVVNDTLKVDVGLQHYAHYVQSVSTVTISGMSYRVWKMVPSFGGANATYLFIEGIGSLSGIGFPIAPHIFESGQQLRCFTNKGSTPASSPPLPLPYANGHVAFGASLASYFDNSTSCTLAIDDAYITSGLASVVPNPATSLSKIKLPGIVHAGSLSIYNSIGQKILQQDITDASELSMPVGIKGAGMYFYEIRDTHSKTRYVGRFIFE